MRFLILPVFLLCAVLVFLCLPGVYREKARAFRQHVDALLYPVKPDDSAGREGGTDTPAGAFSVEMLDVGQGLAVLVGCGGHYMMYDGGGSLSSSYVVSRLKSEGIRFLDCIVASHFDEDHIYGLIGVMHALGCSEVIIPDYTAETAVYERFMKTLGEKKYPSAAAYAGMTRPLGDALMTVVGPLTQGAADENDRSVMVRVQYGKTAVLLTGDAGFEEENEVLESGADLSSDICVAGHHGSAGSAGSTFLEAVSPSAVLVSCGLHNDFGHPARQTLGRIRESGAELYRTDLQGGISAVSDGNAFSFFTQPCGSWLSGEELDTLQTGSGSGDGAAYGAAAGDENPAPEGPVYLCNRRSRVFHRVFCENAAGMSDWNRIYSYETREQLLEEGYTPCGWCRP